MEPHVESSLVSKPISSICKKHGCNNICAILQKCEHKNDGVKCEKLTCVAHSIQCYPCDEIVCGDCIVNCTACNRRICNESSAKCEGCETDGCCLCLTECGCNTTWCDGCYSDHAFYCSDAENHTDSGEEAREESGRETAKPEQASEAEEDNPSTQENDLIDLTKEPQTGIKHSRELLQCDVCEDKPAKSMCHDCSQNLCDGCEFTCRIQECDPELEDNKKAQTHRWAKLALSHNPVDRYMFVAKALARNPFYTTPQKASMMRNSHASTLCYPCFKQHNHDKHGAPSESSESSDSE